MNERLTSLSYAIWPSDYFKVWPWKSKAKFKRVVEGQNPIVGSASNRPTSFSFHIIRDNAS